MADLGDTIETVAGEPAKAEGDQGSATNQPLLDLIAADRYLAGKTALGGSNADGGKKSGGRLLRTGKIVNQGAV